jgi:hypothetical protein
MALLRRGGQLFLLLAAVALLSQVRLSHGKPRPFNEEDDEDAAYDEGERIVSFQGIVAQDLLTNWTRWGINCRTTNDGFFCNNKCTGSSSNVES